MNNTLIISNNKLVKENLSTDFEVIFVDGTLLEIMERARDMVHRGYILLTHPLSGSIKPNQTPYKSIALEKRTGKVDFDSLIILEDSISRTKSLLKNKPTPDWPEKYLEDFRLIDYDLIKNAL
ncbi:MAG: GrdX protein [Firmicutes bacterium]|nr:GrdX protein [Bacillota bacterium]MDI6704953.1 GrdX family protein [Bacillota bacterium]